MVARSRELVCNETQDSLEPVWQEKSAYGAVRDSQGEGHLFLWEGEKVLMCHPAGEGAGHQHTRGRGMGCTFIRGSAEE